MNLTKRQNEIIDAALKLTAEGGIQNLTVKKLGNEIGVTEPAIYRHFASKGEIVKEMIHRFDREVPIDGTEGDGVAAIKRFIRGRLEQIQENPDLAKVMFAEELFLSDAECQNLLRQMMHRHKAAFQKHFQAGMARGDIRGDIGEDILFRLVFGPIRLLVKQWGMSGHAFDLRARGEEHLAVLFKILAPNGAEEGGNG